MGKKKNPDATPGEKLLGLYCTLLYKHRAMSLTELAETLECSKQTVSRLFDQLETSAYGQIQRSQRGKEAYYSLERSEKKLDQLSLDAEGLAQLALCRDFITHLLPENIRKKISRTLDMSAAYLPSGEQKAPPHIGQGLGKGTVDYSPHQETLQALREAIADGRLCQVTYRADRGKAAKTHFYAPKKLLAFQGSLRVSGWIVDGRATARAKYETPTILSVQRITQVEPLSKSGSHLPEPPLEQNAFGLMSDDLFTARIRFKDEAAAYVEERIWSANQSFEQEKGGSLILTFQAQSSLEVLSFALGFGPQAEILSPDWLRAEMVQSVKEMTGVYEKRKI